MLYLRLPLTRELSAGRLTEGEIRQIYKDYLFYDYPSVSFTLDTSPDKGRLWVEDSFTPDKGRLWVEDSFTPVGGPNRNSKPISKITLEEYEWMY